MIVINDQINKGVELEQVAKEIRLVSLDIPDSIFFGEINSIKTVNGKMYLLDQSQTQTITIIDSNGEFFGQLNNRGEGPGQYDVIHDFSIDEQGRTIIIYDRNSFEFLFYDLETLSFLKAIKSSKTFMSFEVIDVNKWLTISDSRQADNSLVGVEIINSHTLSTIETLFKDASRISIQASESIFLTKNKDVLYYALPDFQTTLYAFDNGKINNRLVIDFGSSNVDIEIMNQSRGEFIKHLSDKDRSIAAHFFIIDNNKAGFWFMRGGFRNQLFAEYEFTDGTINVYSGLTHPALKEILPPARGVTENEYIHLLYPNQLDDIFLKNSKESSFFETIGRNFDSIVKSENPLLLLYKLR